MFTIQRSTPSADEDCVAFIAPENHSWLEMLCVNARKDAQGKVADVEVGLAIKSNEQGRIMADHFKKLRGADRDFATDSDIWLQAGPDSHIIAELARENYLPYELQLAVMEKLRSFWSEMPQRQR